MSQGYIATSLGIVADANVVEVLRDAGPQVLGMAF